MGFPEDILGFVGKAAELTGQAANVGGGLAVNAASVVAAGLQQAIGAGVGVAQGMAGIVGQGAALGGQIAAGGLATVHDVGQQVLQAAAHVVAPQMPKPPAKTVFVVHGRDLVAWEATRDFLQALDLSPQNFDTLIENGSLAPPATIQEVLSRAFALANAVVVLFTPDEESLLLQSLGDDDRCLQPRANVFVEAGMALGLHARRTVLVTFKGAKLPSDLANYALVEFGDDNDRARRCFRGQLRAAGVDVGGKGDYKEAGDFEAVMDRIRQRTNHRQH